MKTIKITDVSVKEIRIGFDTDGSFAVTILYAEIKDDGTEMAIKWSDPIKGDELTTLLKNRLKKVLESVVENVKSKEKI